MTMLLPEVTAPTESPVTLDYVKEHTVVYHDDDDALLAAYITAATHYLDGPEGVLGRALMPQAVVQRLPALTERTYLRYGPAISITSVEYYDTDNVLQTLTGWSLLQDQCGSLIYYADTLPEFYDRPDAVVVTYQAGFSEVPESINLAIAMLAATWHMTRETVGSGTQLPFGVSSMIAPFRRVTF